MKLNWVLLTAALTSPVAAQSQEDATARLTECRKIINKDDRLSCFDSIPTIIVRPMNEQKLGDAEDWRFVKTSDKLTKEERFLIARNDRSGEHAIIIKCDKRGKNSLYIHFLTPRYLGSIGSQTSAHVLKYRFGEQGIIATKYVPDGSSAAILDNTAVRKFLEQARTEAPLIVVATAFDHKSTELEFDMSGAKAAIDRVSASCSH